jgi:hypothetical protein
VPALAGQKLIVHGLGDLQRAFATAGKQASKELREGLKDVAEPIRIDAEHRAVDEISRIGPSWQRMRAVTRRNVVYVAPVERGRQSRRNPRLRRPNLAGLLMDKAMEPALEAHTEEVVERFDRLLVQLGTDWEHV